MAGSCSFSCDAGIFFSKHPKGRNQGVSNRGARPISNPVGVCRCGRPILWVEVSPRASRTNSFLRLRRSSSIFPLGALRTTRYPPPGLNRPIPVQFLARPRGNREFFRGTGCPKQPPPTRGLARGRTDRKWSFGPPDRQQLGSERPGKFPGHRPSGLLRPTDRTGKCVRVLRTLPSNHRPHPVLLLPVLLHRTYAWIRSLLRNLVCRD